METTLFLARLYGMVFLVFGIGMMVNKSYYKKLIHGMVENEVFMFFGGIMALVAGVSIISYHNIWSNPLAAVISFFGWIGVLKGLMLLLLPDQFTKEYKNWMKSEEIVFGYGVVIAVLGLILSYTGFFM